MKKIIFLFVIQYVALQAFSQQLPQYSQYLRNQFMLNPGAAGIYEFTDVTMSGRMQWLGFENAPKTTYASVTAIVSPKPKVRYNPSLHISTGPVRNPEIKTGYVKHAIGGQLVADQYGPFRQVQFSGTYAIHLPISKKINMSLGTKVGLSTHTFLPERAQVLNPLTDLTYTNYTINQGNRTNLDIGSGLYVYSKKMFFGVAIDQLSKDLVSYGPGTADFNTKMHFNMMGAYKITLNEDMTLSPAFLIKYIKPFPLTAEATLQFEYKEWFWISASYRYKDAIIGMLGLNISNRFKFGYSYDFSLSHFSNCSSGGHELILGIMIGR